VQLGVGSDDMLDPLLDLRRKRAKLRRGELAHVDLGESRRYGRTDVVHPLAQRSSGPPLAFVEPNLL
jgi:hypothetical protein